MNAPQVEEEGRFVVLATVKIKSENKQKIIRVNT